MSTPTLQPHSSHLRTSSSTPQLQPKGTATGSAVNMPTLTLTHSNSSSNNSTVAAAASSTAATSPSAIDKLLLRLDTCFGGTSTTLPKKSSTLSMTMSLTGVVSKAAEEGAVDLLSELEKTLKSTDKSSLSRSHTSLSKLFLLSILPKCDSYILRNLGIQCFTSLLELNSVAVQNVYHELLKYMETKDVQTKIVGIQCFAALTRKFGSMFLLSIPEILAHLLKLAKARDELVLKLCMLDFISAYYEGTSGSSRSCGSTDSTYFDMMKLLTRYISDKSSAVRKKVYETARCVVYYSVDCKELDPILSLCFKTLPIEYDVETKYHASELLGDMLSIACRKDWTQIMETQKKATTTSKSPGVYTKRTYDVHTIEDAWIHVEKCLVTTLNLKAAAAVAQNNLLLRTSYLQVIARCLRNLCTNNPHHLLDGAVRFGYAGRLATASKEGGMLDEKNIEVNVLRWIQLLSKTTFSCTSTGILGGSTTLSTFSLPTATSPVIDAQNDQNLRQFMSICSGMLLKNVLQYQSERSLELVGITVVGFLSTLIKATQNKPSLNSDLQTNYQVLLCFNILSSIYISLGLSVEYMHDLKEKSLEVLLVYLTHPSYHLRISSAQCFRSLARAASPQIATWCSVLYKIVVMLMVEVEESQENAQHQQQQVSGKKSAGVIEIDPAPYYSLHGHISALSAIVGVVPETPCGVPSSILESIYDVAKKLLALAPEPSSTSTPTGASSASSSSSLASSNHLHIHTLIESGWLLLSSLISLGFDWNASRLNSLFFLWRQCLGKKSIQGKQKQEDIYLELRLRSKSLLALRTFITVMKSRMKMILIHGVLTPSPILKATIIFLRNTFSLLKALSTEKTLDPSVQLALTQMKAVLIDLFAALPAVSYSQLFVPLLHIVVSEFTSKNPLSNTELVRILTKTDSILNTPFPSVNSESDDGYIRYLDASYDTESIPTASSATGIPLPSISSFYEQFIAAGQIQPDFSWNWVLRADVASSPIGVAGAGGAGLQRQSSAGDADEEEGASLRQGYDDSVSIDSDLLADTDSLTARPLWSSLRNHLDRSGGDVSHHASECYESPALRSINACIRLFGTIYAEQSATHQEQLCKHFLAVVTKAKSMNSMYTNIVTNVATALLAVARDLVQREVTVKSAAAFDTILSTASELMSATNPLVRRAVGEIYGLLVRVNDGDFLGKLVTSLQNQLHAHAKEESIVCTTVFALGCVHRYGGAMKTMRHLPFTIAALQSLSREYTEPQRIWILHSLWLAIDTGGLAFNAYVQPTLAILSAHALHDIEPRTPGVNLTIGRILHAVMSALGPDVVTAAGVDKFLHLWTHLRATSQDTKVATQIEVIGVLHQLIMWLPSSELESIAPGTIDLLSCSLSSEDEDLRRITLRTLFQLSEKDPSIIAKGKFEQRLVYMMDTEANVGMKSLVKYIVMNWIHVRTTGEEDNESAAQPSIRVRLLDVCKRAVVPGHKLPSDSLHPVVSPQGNNTKKKKAVATPNPDEKDDEDEDDDGNILASGSSSSSAAAASSSSSSSSSSSDGDLIHSSGIYIPSETRWQTKSFALDCLSSLIKVAYKTCSHEKEFNLSYARKNHSYPLQYLIQQLPDLLTISCLATSSLYDMLRIRGLTTMKVIVECFQDVKDPDSEEGEMLLSLYSAQITSACSECMKNRTGGVGQQAGGGTSASHTNNNSSSSDLLISLPQLRSRACELSVTYLLSGITHDTIVYTRLIKLFLQPLQDPDPIVSVLNNQYDGNMSTLVILAHVHALGVLHSTVLANEDVQEKRNKRLLPKHRAILTIRSTLSPHFSFLSSHYFRALKDYILISTLPRKEIAKMKGFYFDGAIASNANPLPVYSEYWEIFLKNLCHCEKGERDLEKLIGSDGSIATGQVRKELYDICLGVIMQNLMSCATQEWRMVSNMTNMMTTQSTLQRGVSDKLKRVPSTPASSPNGNTSSDGVVLEDLSSQRPTLEKKEHSIVITCLSSLTDLICLRYLQNGRLTRGVIQELIPLLQWLLTHRPAGMDMLVAGKRQACVMEALQALIQGVKELASEDSSAIETFLSSAANDNPSSTTSDFFQSLSDIFSTTIHTFLPSFGGSAATPSVSTTHLSTMHKLVDGGIYLTPDVVSTLGRLLTLMPSFIELVARSTSDATVLTSQVSTCVGLLQHIMRKATQELSTAALSTLITILSLPSSSESVRITPSINVCTHLTLHLHTILLSPLPLDTDYRVECLLASLYNLCSSLIPPDASDQAVADGIAKFVAVWNTYHTHSSSRFRTLALHALQKHVLVAPSAAMMQQESAIQHSQKCQVALVRQVSSTLLLSIQSPSSTVEESSASIQCVLNIFHSLVLPASLADSIKSTWLPLLLPLLVDHLPRSPSSIIDLVSLATQQPVLFKTNVALLPIEYRMRLQTAVLGMTPEQQAVARERAATVGAASMQQQQQPTAKESENTSSKAIKKPSKKRETSGENDTTATTSAPSITLSMDFSNFKKK